MAHASGARDLYTLFDFLSAEDRAYLGDLNIQTSRLQNLPGVERYYRYLIGSCCRAIESFDLRAYDTLLTSSACFAKGILTGADQKHIAYIHSPPRYAWDLTHEYLETATGWGGLKRKVAERAFHKLRLWDMRTVHAMDTVLANSQFVARRIKKLYGRSADVLYPPVHTERFGKAAVKDRDDHYLIACRLVGYKRVDVIVRAFNLMPDKKLVVVGEGPDRSALERLAGPNVQFVGYQDHDQMASVIARAKAFVYAAIEDFGIVPLEAQAAGVPVIAYGAGGVLETVNTKKGEATGILFPHQTPESLRDAVERFDAQAETYSAEACQTHASNFATQNFHAGLQRYLP